MHFSIAALLITAIFTITPPPVAKPISDMGPSLLQQTQSLLDAEITVITKQLEPFHANKLAKAVTARLAQIAETKGLTEFGTLSNHANSYFGLARSIYLLPYRDLPAEQVVTAAIAQSEQLIGKLAQIAADFPKLSTKNDYFIAMLSQQLTNRVTFPWYRGYGQPLPPSVTQQIIDWVASVFQEGSEIAINNDAALFTVFSDAQDKITMAISKAGAELEPIEPDMLEAYELWKAKHSALKNNLDDYFYWADEQEIAAGLTPDPPKLPEPITQ